MTRTCTNPYGPESGPHDGPPDYAAVLVGSRGTELTRVAPLCRAHAEYERSWRASLGAIATVQVERMCSKLDDGCPLPADHDGFCQAPESWRITSKTPAELAELALTLHRAVARNDDPAISNGDSPYYLATSRALRVIVAQAYPDLDASEVYDVADDGGESIAHAAGYLRERARTAGR